MIFKTSEDQIIRLKSIINAMYAARLHHSFVVAAETIAKKDQGVFELIELWHNQSDDFSKKAIENDIQECINDYVVHIKF